MHVRTATQAEFFQHLEQNARNLPVHRGEWTDWWSEGVAATPQDTLVFRNAQRTRHLIDLLDPDGKVVSPERRAAIDDKLMLYAEHTFGYSHTSLSTLLTQQVFMRKTKHAVDADVLASRRLYDVLRTRGEGDVHRPAPLRIQGAQSAEDPGSIRGLSAAGLLGMAHRPGGFSRGGRHRQELTRTRSKASPRGWTVARAAGPGRRRGTPAEARGPWTGGSRPKLLPARRSRTNGIGRRGAKDKGITSLTDRATGTQVLDPAIGRAGLLRSTNSSPAATAGRRGTIHPPRKRPPTR